MAQITIKLIATLLTLILCISCLSACKDNETQDNQSTNSTESHCVDEETSETIDTSENKTTETTEPDVESNIPENSTSNTNSTGCAHNSTTLKNKTSATCTKTGYTGDNYCTKCNKKISSGSQIPATGHNTEIRNKKDATTTSEGYTGDKVCKTCGTVVESGKKISKVENNTAGKVTYTTNNGYTYVVDEGTDITAYTMALKTKQISSPYREVEKEILRLCNIEREKVGLKPLTWYEDPYYFTHIRSEEIYLYWGHQRPNNTPWHTVYTDTGVILDCACGENLAQFEGWAAEQIAQEAVRLWMNSPGHRENILRESFTKMTVAIDCSDDGISLSVTQHFFG